MPPRLNYSKWDKLELSDDSDVEVHPNVDKKSFIRMKQRTIHEKRDERKHRMLQLELEIELNDVLLPRLTTYINSTLSDGTAFVRKEAARLQESKNTDKPLRSTGPSYDEMMLSLLLQASDDSTVKESKTEEGKVQALVKIIQKHRDTMVKRTETCQQQLAAEKAEIEKHITAEDISVGFDSGHVNKNAASAQPVEAVVKKTDKGKGKQSETTIEVLNPKSVQDKAETDTGNVSDGESEAEDIPDMSPNVARFSKIPSDNWAALFSAISSDTSLLGATTVDTLLLEAFNTCGKPNPDYKYARQCVNQSLLLQYCARLGQDGVNLFFKRMTTNSAGQKVFHDDVNTTFERIKTRSKALAEERDAAGSKESEEAIQLVATDENTKIGFNVPSGPPPEHLVLEGEGTEDLDIEDVRAFLQNRWDTFTGFPKNLQKALEKNDLASVNKVLAKMQMEEAEEVVRQLDQARILSFSESGVQESA